MYILSAGILFAPIPENKLNSPPIVTPLLSVCQAASPALIDSSIKAFGTAGGPADTVGPKIWMTVINQVFEDIIKIYTMAIPIKLNSSLPIAPPGAASPVCVMLAAPAPALLAVPWVGAGFEAFLRMGLNQGQATSLGQTIYNKLKAAAKNFEGQNCLKYGEFIWDTWLEVVCPVINTSLETAIKLYLTVPGTNWWIPAGVLGTLILPPAIPTFSVPVPGKIM
jgi:hypothetical protein